MSLVRGNWEIVESQGRRLLRNTGPRYSAVQIVLPGALPERFTIEIETYFAHSNQQLVVATSAPAQGSQLRDTPGQNTSRSASRRAPA